MIPIPPAMFSPLTTTKSSAGVRAARQQTEQRRDCRGRRRRRRRTGCVRLPPGARPYSGDDGRHVSEGPEKGPEAQPPTGEGRNGSPTSRDRPRPTTSRHARSSRAGSSWPCVPIADPGGLGALERRWAGARAVHRGRAHRADPQPGGRLPAAAPAPARTGGARGSTSDYSSPWGGDRLPPWPTLSPTRCRSSPTTCRTWSTKPTENLTSLQEELNENGIHLELVKTGQNGVADDPGQSRQEREQARPPRAPASSPKRPARSSTSC